MTLLISDSGEGLPVRGDVVLVATADTTGTLPRYCFEIGQILMAPDSLACDATAEARERRDLEPVLPGARCEVPYVECEAVSATGDL